MNRTRETDRFTVYDVAGQSYTMIEYTDFIEVSSAASKTEEWERGMKSYRLENGHACNSGGSGIFENPRTGATLRRQK